MNSAFTLSFAFDSLLAILLLASAWRALATPHLGRALLSFVVFGLLMALAWARLDAPDIALAEAAVGAGLSGVLLFDAWRALQEKPEASGAEERA
jgi:energy-converting hydrogenase B subunit D